MRDPKCRALPPIGSPSTYRTARASAPDSALLTGRLAGVVGTFSWSSDSLDAIEPAQWVIALDSNDRGRQSLHAAAQSPLGGREVTVRTEPGRYRMRLQAIGAYAVSDTLTLRLGYLDSVFVHLQRAGIGFCQ